jgi:hypothetical protein
MDAGNRPFLDHVPWLSPWIFHVFSKFTQGQQKQTNKHTHKHTNKQTNNATKKTNKQTHEQTNKHLEYLKLNVINRYTGIPVTYEDIYTYI